MNNGETQINRLKKKLRIIHKILLPFACLFIRLSFITYQALYDF